MSNVNMVALGTINPAITRIKQVGTNLSRLFNSGKFKINGAIIKINTGEPLTLIADKINKYKGKTGLTAEVINNNQLVLKSKKPQVDIIDYGVLSKIVKQGMLGAGSNCLLRIVKAELAGEISENVIINYSQGKKTAGHRNACPLLDGEINEHLAEVEEAEAARKAEEEARRLEAERRAEAARIVEEIKRAEKDRLRIIKEICTYVSTQFEKTIKLNVYSENYSNTTLNDLPTIIKKVDILLNTFDYNYLKEREVPLATRIFNLLNNKRVDNSIIDVFTHPSIYWGSKFAITNDNWRDVHDKILVEYTNV